MSIPPLNTSQNRHDFGEQCSIQASIFPPPANTQPDLPNSLQRYCCWNSFVPLSILSLSVTRVAYPVIIQTKAFGHALWNERLAGRKVGARKQYGMLVRPSSGQMIRVCAQDRGSAGRNATLKESDTGKRRIGGGYRGSRRFLGDGCLLFISMIVFCGRERGTCGEEIDPGRD